VAAIKHVPFSSATSLTFARAKIIFNAADSGEGGTVSISDEFRLREDLAGLPLVLGLLSDWVSFNCYFTSFKSPNLISIQIMNSKERKQQFFTYFNP
jgi:hypothetical protein